MNADRLKSLSIFADVVRVGGFREAARRLGMTPSAVSYHVKVLETELGTSLLYRSTRKMALTEAGEELYNAALAMMEAAESGFHAAKRIEAGLTGRMKIAVSSSLAHSGLTADIVRFHCDNPNVELDLVYADRIEDLIADRFDLALRAGRLEDSTLKCRLVWDMPRMLVCSPAFRQGRKPIRFPSDLQDVPWIKFAKLEPRRSFSGPGGKHATIEQSGSITVNSIEAMVDLTLLGAAISSPPAHYVAKAVAAGDLVQLLPDWRMEAMPVHAVWPSAGIDNPVTKRLVGYLTGQANSAA
ncbi:LysR family transcriptional regulator [Hwanghaeella sp.]|uniref:LysR family transcriptional regulator n=1 Tax=Hwanghaeella sp. TaxID=2605943 RepID=UPI003CCC2EF3